MHQFTLTCTLVAALGSHLTVGKHDCFECLLVTHSSCLGADDLLERSHLMHFLLSSFHALICTYQLWGAVSLVWGAVSVLWGAVSLVWGAVSVLWGAVSLVWGAVSLVWGAVSVL